MLLDNSTARSKGFAAGGGEGLRTGLGAGATGARDIGGTAGKWLIGLIGLKTLEESATCGAACSGMKPELYPEL